MTPEHLRIRYLKIADLRMYAQVCLSFAVIDAIKGWGMLTTKVDNLCKGLGVSIRPYFVTELLVKAFLQLRCLIWSQILLKNGYHEIVPA